MKSRDNKEFWQRTARIYTPFMKGNAPMYREICERIRPHLTENMKVLELACGPGQLSFPLCRYVKLWEATDFSENMIAEARKQPKSSRLHFAVQDATNLPYASESFDAVVISNALHIMPEPAKALAESRRVLKPGGVLFAPTFLHGNGEAFGIRNRLMELAGFRTFSKWSEEEFKAFIAAGGFSITETKILGSKIMPLCYLSAEKEEAAQWSV